MKRVILVAGTWGWNPGSPTVDWWMPGSPFVAFLKAQGVQPIFGEYVANDAVSEPRPFTWSTDLEGIDNTQDWHAAGINLYDYCVPPVCPSQRIPVVDTNLIVHSHGLQVALFAAHAGLKINTLISVGSPIRHDVAKRTPRARMNIARWVHVHSDASDTIQLLGSLFDGHLGVVREAALADRNEMIGGVGHAGLLRDPKLFHFWVERGWLA